MWTGLHIGDLWNALMYEKCAAVTASWSKYCAATPLFLCHYVSLHKLFILEFTPTPNRLEHEGLTHNTSEHTGLTHNRSEHKGWTHNWSEHKGLTHNRSEHKGWTHNTSEHKGWTHNRLEHKGSLTTDQSKRGSLTTHPSIRGTYKRQMGGCYLLQVWFAITHDFVPLSQSDTQLLLPDFVRHQWLLIKSTKHRQSKPCRLCLEPSWNCYLQDKSILCNPKY